MFDPDFSILCLGLLVCWWIAASIAVKFAAQKRGYDGGIWLCAGLFLGPIFAVLLLIAHPPLVIDEAAHTGGSLSITPRLTLK